jgi:hypothetical protein
MGILSNIMSGGIKPLPAAPKEAKVVLPMGDMVNPVPEKPSLIGGLDPWLHPTKGWRKFARPRGTNKRRVLSPAAKDFINGKV